MAAGNNSGAMEMEISDIGDEATPAPADAQQPGDERTLVWLMRAAQVSILLALGAGLAWAANYLLGSPL